MNRQTENRQIVALLIALFVFGLLTFGCDTLEPNPRYDNVRFTHTHVTLDGTRGWADVDASVFEPARLKVTFNRHVTVTDTTLQYSGLYRFSWRTPPGWGHPPILGGDTFEAELIRNGRVIDHETFTDASRLSR